MSFAYIRISLLRARRVSSSYTEKNSLYSERYYTKNFSWPKSCTDPVSINDDLHVKL